ncbi:cyclin-domain-containing protein [Choiromyces venosus 120613-1]|uniref:Cyclin-domain-containing protein n=1 Tax=Choiromyces venosus 120613-1 TaxID=1336337 RepID=A0A3N4J4A7_9PEZI|nr:cyclin-domain-containing protein [Choiromyces venosus 120613-1]
MRKPCSRNSHPHVILDHEKIPREGAPPPPHPLVDPAGYIAANTHSVNMSSTKPLGLRADDNDIFHLPPSTALTLLSRSIELLVSITGDVPPTPPASGPSTPDMEEELHPTANDNRRDGAGFCFGNAVHDSLDGVALKHKRDEYSDDDDVSDGGVGAKGAFQNGAITRKFWSKAAPGISIEDYLFRIHRFCPLSTAVYLAASVYLHRLAVTERIIPITRLNVHRLLLAALRVASKGLEDLSHPHKRFAKVGGLTELELSRLEVSFCFLMNFDLKVDKAALEKHMESLRETVNRQASLGTSGLVLPATPPKESSLASVGKIKMMVKPVMLDV